MINMREYRLSTEGVKDGSLYVHKLAHDGLILPEERWHRFNLSEGVKGIVAKVKSTSEQLMKDEGDIAKLSVTISLTGYDAE